MWLLSWWDNSSKSTYLGLFSIPWHPLVCHFSRSFPGNCAIYSYHFLLIKRKLEIRIVRFYKPLNAWEMQATSYFTGLLETRSGGRRKEMINYRNNKSENSIRIVLKTGLEVRWARGQGEACGKESNSWNAGMLRAPCHQPLGPWATPLCSLDHSALRATRHLQETPAHNNCQGLRICLSVHILFGKSFKWNQCLFPAS